jgi:phage FluMu protein Com
MIHKQSLQLQPGDGAEVRWKCPVCEAMNAMVIPRVQEITDPVDLPCKECDAGLELHFMRGEEFN